MAIRRPPTTFSDEISAADLAANSVTASELADDAVDTAAIADGAVDADRLATDAVTSAKIATGAVIADGIGAGAVVTAGLGASAVTKEKIAASAIEVKPHIIPGVLYPALLGNKLDGTATANSTTGPAGSTVAESKYGTVQSDGRMYYYTDIKGSKPIKDPRIGSHFGGQRHKFKSLQKLKQETAEHGSNTYSIDGREWCRVVGNAIVFYGDGGSCIRSDEGGTVTPNFFVEIVGYFNDFNCISKTGGNRVDDINVTVNGTSTNSADTDKLGGRATANSPLRNRYVDMGSVINHGDSTVTTNLGTTPKINTIKIEAINTGSEYWDFFGIELIAQDTTSTTNKSKIQIPAQNVVSYGKKFALGAAAHHYNPFAFKGDGTTASTIPNNTTGDSVATGWAGSTSAYWEPTLDTATSLGLAAWVEGGAYYRPVNGGRIVKWIDSTGAIKTSVNMMPPSAKGLGSHSGDATPTGATNWSTQILPIFSSGVVDHTQAEVAKTFWWREFGNGNVNAGAVTSSAGGNYKDFSMLTGTTGAHMGFVLDDGLTSLSAKNCEINTNGLGDNLGLKTTDSCIHYTFIGTGITISDYNGAPRTFAQNLPYGTHILKQHHDGTNVDWFCDGVQLLEGDSGDTGITAREITYHQPKMPPIPEDACIIADYMLMADHVVQTDCEPTQISKGVRYISGSRDHFCNAQTSAFSEDTTLRAHEPGQLAFAGFSTHASQTGSALLPFFGTNAQAMVYGSHTAGYSLELGGAGKTEIILDSSADIHDDMITIADSEKVTLGNTSIKTNLPSGGYRFIGSAVATPIHTSSHYQEFETPYLRELVGGDRNMEQNNLIVTSDGKSWDEVTRDTSYIGNVCVAPNLADSSGNVAASVAVVWNVWRGSGSGAVNKMGPKSQFYNKDFAIAYDRVICLVDGQYRIQLTCIGEGQSGGPELKVNGKYIQQAHFVAGNHDTSHVERIVNLVRGDYVSAHGFMHNNDSYQSFHIHRV